MTPFKALIVEGTSGVGKSTLIDALIRHHIAKSPPRKVRSLIHLAQSHTYGPLAIPEDRGTLTVAQNLDHLDRIGSLLEWLSRSVQEHAKPWCFVVADSLHLTHCVRPGVVQWADVASIDHRLAALGCKLIFLRASSNHLWKYGIEPRIDQQFLLEYAKKIGRTNEEIHSHFVREQDILAGLFAQSAMPKLLMQADGTPESLVEEAYRFWMQEPITMRLTEVRRVPA